MAGPSSLLIRIAGLASQLDEEALASLANKGLARRASKDLAGANPVLGEEGSGRLKINFADAIAELTEPLAMSRCSCPAGGICRHILMSLIFLKENQASLILSSSPPVSSDESAPVPTSLETPVAPPILSLASVGNDQLEKWGGRTLFRKATEILAQGIETEIEELAEGNLLFKFPSKNLSVRYFSASGLEGMLCSCHKSPVCEHRVVAILAWQIRFGNRQVDPVIPKDASSGTPRTREEVRASVAQLLREMLAVGLNMVSEATENRLRTLSISAQGVDLVRLQRLLHSFSDEIRSTLNRGGDSSLQRVLELMSRIEALQQALANPKPGLIGQHRTQYDKVGDVELIGAGAQRWRTRSGFVGLTCYFWDLQLKRWTTWSETRPEGTPGFDPAIRFESMGPWSGCPSPRYASQYRIRLSGLYRNPMGRLSGRESTRFAPVEKTKLDQLPCCSVWSELRDKIIKLYEPSLQERSELEHIVCVRPLAFGPSQYDEINQEFRQPIIDQEGSVLFLGLSHGDETKEAIQFLEQAQHESGTVILGGLKIVRSNIVLEPISLLSPKASSENCQIRSLTLEGSISSKKHSTPPRTEPVEEPPEEVIEDLFRSNTPIGMLLQAAIGELEAYAELGVHSPRDPAPLRKIARDARSLGMESIFQVLDRFVEGIERRQAGLSQSASDQSGLLLKAHWVLQIASAQESLLLVMGSLTGSTKSLGPAIADRD